MSIDARHVLPGREPASREEAVRIIGEFVIASGEARGRFKGGPHGSDRGSLGQLDLVERAEDSQVAFELESQFDGGDLFGVAMSEVGEVPASRTDSQAPPKW